MRGKQTETRLSFRRSRSFRRRFDPRSLFHRFRLIPPVRRRSIAVAGLVIVAELVATVHYLIPETSYALGTASEVLTPVNQQMAAKMSFDASKQMFSFNDKQVETLNKQNVGLAATQQPKITAYTDPKKGITVNDSSTGADFTMKPRFGLTTGRRDGNRIVYPLTNGNDGWAVYTMHAVGVKEDIVLTASPGDNASFDYDLGLAEGQEARLEADGSVGVYGNNIFSGSVSAGTEADAKLLEKARKNAPKDTRLFSIPAPTIVEKDGESQVEARFDLTDGGKRLTVHASHLDRGQYPLSIDPSIYVVTAQQFMQGNNETNIDFNVSDKLIQKGNTTGARFDSWNASAVNLPAPAWSGAAAAAGGYMYQLGGTTFNGQTFTSQGSNSYVVPTGVTSLTFKAWGGGGGSGAGASSTGGTGGGGGYVTSIITVTPGETLTIYVGGGGVGGTHNALGSLAGGGGGGGGFTSVYRGGAPLLIVGGGAGGGGSRASDAGGTGGAGGGTTGLNGTSIATNNGAGGNGGTPSAGGTSPTSTDNDGTAGSSLTGGNGGDGRSGDGADGSGAVGGGGGGANGGAPNINITRAAGGGGGGGYFGGGGGGATSSTTGAAGGGGGGGSSYTAAGSTSVTNSAGSGTAPGNAADTGRNGAGTGGLAGPANNNGLKGSGGALLITNGAGGSTVSSGLSWAHLNDASGDIEGADPGSGACSGWCSTSAYNLPAARRDLSMVAYNGFLYAIGGTDGSAARTSTVYVAKLGANGEPRKWHPSSTDESTWTYWNTTTTLTSSRSLAGAVAYNNRLYLIGGLTGAGTGTSVTTVEYADINPMGTLGSWTAGTALPTGLIGHGVQAYNDRLYVLGGANTYNGAGSTTVSFIKLTSAGAMTGGWQTSANSFNNARVSGGGNMTAIWGGYLYISGGCGTMNASGYCSSTLSDTQVASINADGSVGVWNQVGTVSSQRTGASLVTWRNRIYHIGGCSSQNTGTGDCNAAILGTINQGTINPDGDASTVGQSSASGAGSCNAGVSSTNCDTPSTIGNMLTAAVITKGYLYVIGGCTNNACSTASTAYSYAAISSTGVTSRPTACGGTYTNNIWCTITATNQLASGVAASSPVVFNGRIYLVGGLGGSGNNDNIDRAVVNADGSLGTWTRQTMTGADTGANPLEAQSYLFAYARANPASAGTSPGNLFVLGGCSASSAAGCTNYSPDTHKCNIAASDGAVSGCNAAGQLQIGTLPGATSDGLGLMSGTVYANYIYLMGGVGGNLTDLASLRYAKIDNNNNVVAASGTTWIQPAQTLANGRRRAAGFGYNGYLYVVGGFDANSGVLADIEFIKINVSDGSLDTGGFKESAVTISQRWGLSVPISNSYAYVIGGCIVGASPAGCTARTNVVQTFQIYNNDSGSPAGYATSANTYATNPNRIGASATVYNGKLYVAGGCTSATDCTTAVDTVSYTTIDSATGALSAWTNSSSAATGSLTAVRTWGKLLSAGTSLYYIGGQDSTATNEQSTVYYISPDPSTGAIATWSTATNALPGARTKFGAASWNNRLYVVGGMDAAAAGTNTVYVSPQLNSGGNIGSAWSTSTAFNVNRFGPAVTAYANNLYLFGGNDGTNYLNDSQYAKIDATTGLVGTWNYSTSLPAALSQADAFGANGYIYIQGGRSAAATCNPVTLVAPVSANTTIASGNNPTGVGEWFETNQRFTGARYGAASAYYDGRAYVLGGGCGATLTYGSPVVQQTTVLAQPQVARYSIAIDTDSDVTPNGWLLNGVDNSIGARWQLKYRSMHDLDTLVNPNEDCGTSATMATMTTWGSDTDFGNVTLGLPGVYIPKNGSNLNINCARYYYFSVGVDSSQSFGYPDDVSRGPTITDLTLQFTADPSKRLMHGRTFTGGLQQPIDTPYYAN